MLGGVQGASCEGLSCGVGALRWVVSMPVEFWFGRMGGILEISLELVR